MMKKSKEHKQIIRKNRMRPMFWTVLWERKELLAVVNRITGEFRILDK